MVNCRKEEEESAHDDCVCETSEDNNHAPNERRLQREFLKKHTNSAGGSRQQRKLRHRFLEDAFAAAALGVMDYDDVWMRFKRSSEVHRYRRSSDNTTTVSNVTAVLEEIAKEEIDEVDIIMEDINDEILDLEQSIVVVNNSSQSTDPVPDTVEAEDEESSSGCSVSDTMFVNCSSDVYETPSRLEKSKTYVNEQIRRLRSQLFELKEIRKHLQRKQPKLPRQSKKQRKQCVCGNKHPRRKEQRMARKKQLRQRKERRRQMKKAKKIRKERRKQKRLKDNAECPVNDEFMNCFTHNNDHWKTKPLWTDGAFCACTNSNTNTYSCVRTINATHNYLYCEFVSGIITYYNLNVDPYQLRNIYQTLSDSELNFMHRQLQALKEYSGHDGKWERPMTNSVSQGFRKSLSNRRSGGGLSSKQRQFNRRYGEATGLCVSLSLMKRGIHTLENFKKNRNS